VKSSNYAIGNRTRNLAACSAVELCEVAKCVKSDDICLWKEWFGQIHYGFWNQMSNEIKRLNFLTFVNMFVSKWKRIVTISVCNRPFSDDVRRHVCWDSTWQRGRYTRQQFPRGGCSYWGIRCWSYGCRKAGRVSYAFAIGGETGKIGCWKIGWATRPAWCLVKARCHGDILRAGKSRWQVARSAGWLHLHHSAVPVVPSSVHWSKSTRDVYRF
jgi:hypothetical protein